MSCPNVSERFQALEHTTGVTPVTWAGSGAETRGPGSMQSYTLGTSLGPLLLLRSGNLAGPDLMGEKELNLV